MQRDSKASMLRGRTSETQLKKKNGFYLLLHCEITDVCWDTQSGEKAVKSAAELELTVEVTSYQSVGGGSGGCSL